MGGPLRARPALIETVAAARWSIVDSFRCLAYGTERCQRSRATTFHNAWRDCRRGGACRPPCLRPFE